MGKLLVGVSHKLRNNGSAFLSSVCLRSAAAWGDNFCGRLLEGGIMENEEMSLYVTVKLSETEESTKTRTPFSPMCTISTV